MCVRWQWHGVWRGVPAFYIYLMVAELCDKIKMLLSCELMRWMAMWILWGINLLQPHSARTSYLPSKWNHFEDQRLNFIYLLFCCFFQFHRFQSSQPNTATTATKKLSCMNWNIKVSLHCEPQRAMQMDDMSVCVCSVLIIIVRVLLSRIWPNKEWRQWWSLIHRINVLYSIRLFVRLFVPFPRCPQNAFVILCQKLFHFCFFPFIATKSP